MLLENLEPRVLMSDSHAIAPFSGVAVDPHYGPFPQVIHAVASPFVSVVAPIPGDANCDNIVNFADFCILSNNFGVYGAGWSGGDFNGDGVTDFADFTILSNNFNTAPAPHIYDGRVAGSNVWYPGPTDGGPVVIPAAPLFQAGGPTLVDAVQGPYTDCWLFAGLSSIAGTQPAVILSHVAMDAGGGVVVTLGAYTIHEPLALPLWAVPTNDGTGGGEWAYYVEEAETWYRTKGANPTYASLSQGNLTEITAALGIQERLYALSPPAVTWAAIVAGVAAGQPEQIITQPTGTALLVADHVYSLLGAYTGSDGTQWVELRNPYGYDPLDPNRADWYFQIGFQSMQADAPWVYVGVSP
jgi:hypothetical protein